MESTEAESVRLYRNLKLDIEEKVFGLENIKTDNNCFL